ncbi:MAG TPA: ABC transporter ATP-binding protein [Bacillota bacterium]|nr:ABC transporter ATP-binding protein [Bacillota bacterium]HPF42037.1 ABC transporter ATP-binding protein [Bacillota bacterium]HPJ85889.1 ABC transporter ATP-binding protein [Bacillota bacterium]HPQ61783.1 ABC transporter ATP-binding protein [Bacillota bacterium]HRX91240.1 ABC transporter ATP-binding protein [Candidatus Izemoplasmatales bacterium]
MLFGKHVNKFYWRYGVFFLFGIAALFVVDYTQLEIPNIIGYIIEKLQNGTLDRITLSGYIVSLGIIGAIIVAGRFIWRIFIFGTSRRVDYDLRNEMFAHAEKLSQQYYQEKKSGGLMALFTNDLNAVRMAFGPGIMIFFDVLALGGMAFYKMYLLDPILTLVALIPSLMIAVLATFVSRVTGRKFRDRQKAYENLSDFSQENFYGIAVVKAFANELRETRAFASINKDNYDKNLSFIRVSTLLSVSIEMFINIVRVLLIGIGGYLVYKTSPIDPSQSFTFTIGDLTRYLAYFGALVWPMMAIGRFINLRAQARASLKRIGDFLDSPVDVTDDFETTPVEKIDGAISFKNLTFTYPGVKEPILKNINLEIKAGDTIGIIGPTGSGKTTIADLLLRIYNVGPGMILIDGRDIMTLPVKQVRDTIGYVPQDNFIFSDAIENNISFSQDTIDHKLVEQMARFSDIHDNIAEFPDQYLTMVGERGVTLSGGQKQRISIARALLKKPKILIMDDSFSAVDTGTEEAILENLDKIRSNQTMIIIAHRVSTIKNSDKIVLLSEGKIQAVGTHAELMEKSVEYRNIVLHQQLESELEAGELDA